MQNMDKHQGCSAHPTESWLMQESHNIKKKICIIETETSTRIPEVSNGHAEAVKYGILSVYLQFQSNCSSNFWSNIGNMCYYPGDDPGFVLGAVFNGQASLFLVVKCGR